MCSEGDVRLLELPEHPFFVATLFVPQTSSTPGRPHPLLSALVRFTAETQRIERPLGVADQRPDGVPGCGPWRRAVCWPAPRGYSSEVPAPVDDQFRLRRLRIERQLAPSGRHRWQLRRVSEAHSDQQVPGHRHRRWSSRQLHRLGDLASHAWAGVIVALVALGWVLDGVLTGFPSYWPAILQSVTAVVTVVMLFVIQHLQARDRTVMQRKLDEILRSLPNADNRVIAVEEAPDDELEALTDLNRHDRLG